MFMLSMYIGTYYNIILSWAFFYIFSSFSASLPWSSCDNWWNTHGKYNTTRLVGRKYLGWKSTNISIFEILDMARGRNIYMYNIWYTDTDQIKRGFPLLKIPDKGKTIQPPISFLLSPRKKNISSHTSIISLSLPLVDLDVNFKFQYQPSRMNSL